jgi:hypothetical protein
VLGMAQATDGLQPFPTFAQHGRTPTGASPVAS